MCIPVFRVFSGAWGKLLTFYKVLFILSAFEFIISVLEKMEVYYDETTA